MNQLCDQNSGLMETSIVACKLQHSINVNEHKCKREKAYIVGHANSDDNITQGRGSAPNLRVN